MLPPIQKENAEEKARRVRLLRIWTDICAMALCDMPEGRSENRVRAELTTVGGGVIFEVRVSCYAGAIAFMAVESYDPESEEKLADIQRRLKPYVA